MQDNLGSDRGSQRGDVDFIIGVCFRRFALDHYRVPAGHDCENINNILLQVYSARNSNAIKCVLYNADFIGMKIKVTNLP